MNRAYWSPDFVKQAKSIRVHYVDNAKEKDPPEGFDGQFGAVYSEATVGKLEAGDYSIGIEWYYLNNFYDPERLRLEVIQEYLKYQDDPLLLKIGNNIVPNKSVPTAAKPWK